MARKKKFILSLLVLVLFLVLAVLLSGLKIGDEFVSMPVAPDRISEPGIYTLGEGRLLQVHSSKAGFEYLEGHEDKAESDSSFLQAGSYSLFVIPSVRLEAGWNIEFRPPDQIKISLGSGEIVQRTFGAESSLGSATVTGSVIRHRESKD